MPKKIMWPVRSDCSAVSHNTLRAALGQRVGGGRAARCICPRATALLERERERARRRQSGESGAPGRPKGSADLESLASPAVWGDALQRPDFNLGRCTTPDGRDVMDAYFESPNHDATREEARACCHNCSIQKKCLAWAIRWEDQVGGQQGMYGGLTKAERAALSTRLAAERRLVSDSF